MHSCKLQRLIVSAAELEWVQPGNIVEMFNSCTFFTKTDICLLLHASQCAHDKQSMFCSEIPTSGVHQTDCMNRTREQNLNKNEHLRKSWQGIQKDHVSVDSIVKKAQWGSIPDALLMLSCSKQNFLSVLFSSIASLLSSAASCFAIVSPPDNAISATLDDFSVWAYILHALVEQWRFTEEGMINLDEHSACGFWPELNESVCH